MSSIDWAGLQRERERREIEWDRVLSEVPGELPIVGDRILLNANLFGRGFSWQRCEATVVALSETSILVAHEPAYGSDPIKEEWIHPASVLEVLPRPAVPPVSS